MQKDESNHSDMNETAPPPEENAPAAEKDAAGETSTQAPEPTPLSAEEMQQLQAEAAKAKDFYDRFLRVTADFDNYKKRMIRERQEASKYAQASLLQRLIPVLDHFDMAIGAAEDANENSLQAFHDGIVMIHQQFRAALLEEGLEEIDAADQPFDHNWHEAVSQQPAPDVPEGQVIHQLRKGYKLKDRLLRPASVVVAKKPESESQPDPNAAAEQPTPAAGTEAG